MRLRNALFALSFMLSAFSSSAQVAASYKLFFEKTYLHTDRETYAGGEDIWFKAYLVNAQSNQLFSSSNNLYVELISPTAKIVDRKVIRMSDGLGKGDFKLGDSIPPGNYHLRAYTNWMRNFGDNFIFEKSIRVFSEMAKSKSTVTTQSRFKKVNRKYDDPVFKADSLAIENSLHFLPEGGSMLEDVASRIAYKAITGYGEDIAVTGIVSTISGEKIADLTAATGSFVFTPKTATRYVAKGTFADGEPFTIQLPGVLLSGFCLEVISQDSFFRVAVKTNPYTLAQYKGRKVTLTAKSKGSTCFKKELSMDSLTTFVTLSKNELPAGICAITLFDDFPKPQAERLVYVEEKNPVRLSIIPDKPVYQSKEKVNVLLKASDRNGTPVKTSLSLAVVDASVAKENETDIVSWLRLQSEIKGKIENPGQYFDEKNAKRAEQLDLLLLTQGWRDFIWKRLADSALRISYNLEQGMTVSGYVRRLWWNQPMKDITVNMRTYTVISSKNMKPTSSIFYTQTDSAGRFYMDKIDIYGKTLVKLFSVKDNLKRAGMMKEDSVIAMPLPVKRWIDAPENSLRPSVVTNDMRTAEQLTLRRKQNLKDTIALNEIRLNSNKKLAIRSDVQYLIEEKFRKAYTTVIDFIMAECRDCTMAPRTFGVFLGGFPASFNIKGYVKKWPEFSTDYLTLDLDKVESIQIQRYTNANSGTGGRITLIVKPDAFEDNFNSKYFYVNGYYNSRIFYAPKYESENNKDDQRTTIHWEPNIITNEKGEATISFYNADPKTRIRIVAEGIAENGNPVAATATYTVH